MLLNKINKFLILSATLAISLVNTAEAKTPGKTGLSTADIVGEIEKNLLYIEGTQTIKTDKKISIQHEEWEATTQQTQQPKEKAIEVDIKIAEAPKEKIRETLTQLQKEAYKASKTGHLEVAIDIYKKILKIDSNNTYALFGLATSYHELGQYIKAKELYVKVLEISPGNQRVMSNLLAIITEESPIEAAYLLSRLADNNRDSSYILAQASVANSNIKNYEPAIEYLVRAVNLEPNNLHYKLNLAILADKKGDFRGAYSMYKDLINTVEMRKGEIHYDIPLKQLKRRVKYIRKYLL